MRVVIFDPFPQTMLRVMAGLISIERDVGEGGSLNTITIGRSTETLSSPSAGLVLRM